MAAEFVKRFVHLMRSGAKIRMALNVVFSGVGGQGIVVASDIFCEAALLDGFDVAKAEVHGMAQRGGAIVAHARLGEKVQTPLIERGKADVVLGFEVLETARVLPLLKKEGTVIVNTKYIPPIVLARGSDRALNQENLLCMIRERASIVHEIDALNIAEKLGNTLLVNTIMLGALSALPEIPMKKESFEKAITCRLKEKYVKLNVKAFQQGRENTT
jgi:indolepyruvate ferredoxin oxidoreductase beta subunit